MGHDLAARCRHPPPDLIWLSERVEAVLEPDLPIIDAHHRLWEGIGHPYLLEKISADAGDGHSIEATARTAVPTGSAAHA